MTLINSLYNQVVFHCQIQLNYKTAEIVFK